MNGVVVQLHDELSARIAPCLAGLPHVRGHGTLKAHRARQNEERLRLGSLWEDRGLVFPNQVGKPMNADNLYHRGFKPLLQKAGLSSFIFHSLRHTCATLLVSKNVNPKIVSKMLGHATISQTMDTYSHVMPGMGDVADTALEEALS
jgi:integrase